MGGARESTEEEAVERGARPRAGTLPRGTNVGRYVVLDVIGRGGMGVVYSAYDSQLDRKIAVKFLHADATGESGSQSEGRARLLREAQAMARLSHPNVVAIHDVGMLGEQVFLAMELIDGVTLGEWLKTPRGWREVVAVLVAAGRGLAAAHEAGLIHRDFKPDNVLIGRDGRVTVTDFGVARDQRSRAPSATSESMTDSAERRARALTHATMHSSGSITLTGSLLGTIGYMSPEQAWEETIDARTDQFSLAATLYFALYGERPFPGDGLEAYLDALTKPPREPKSPRDVPRWLHDLIVRALSVRPEARFPSMDAMLEALQPSLQRRRSRVVVGAVAAAIVVSLVAFALAYREHRRSVYAVCERGRDKLDGVWDDDLRRGIRAAFVATGAADAEETYRRVAERLDAHTADWVAMDGEACAATNIRHTQSAEVLALRTACLDRERTEIKSLTALFTRADAAIVQRALEATYGLTSPGWCADVAGLRTAIGLPDNKELRQKVIDVRAQLAEADALRVGGRPKDAQALAERALERAKTVAFPSLTAEAWILIAASHEWAGDYVGAIGPYKQTIFSGQRARADAQVARASARLAFILGDKMFRVDEAEDWWSLATASLDRLGDDQSVRVDLLAARAVLLVAEGRPEESLPLHAQVIDIRNKTLGRDHPLTARAHNNLGYTRQMMGQFDLAMEEHLESFAVDGKTLGPDHPTIAIDESNMGSTLIAMGRYAEAETHLARALAVAEKQSPTSFWAAWALQYMSLAATLRGDPQRGLALGERALAILDKAGGLELRSSPGILVIMGRAQLALGHGEEAQGLCARALPLQERGTLSAERVYEWDALRCLGEARSMLGHAADAIAPLERSVTLVRRVYADDLPRAQFALARALVDSKGDAVRAMTLAKTARDALAKVATAKGDVEAIDKWIAAHGG